jgi:hypothetical protein
LFFAFRLPQKFVTKQLAFEASAMSTAGNQTDVDKEDVYKLIHSTLVSNKGGVPLDKINRTFKK